MSLLVWRDAKTDPPTGDRSILVHDQLTGFTAAGRFYGDDVEKLGITHWAERPVVSDLTDDDVRYAVEAYEKKALSSGAVDMRPFQARVDRLRAALGGEKPDSDGLYHDRIHHEPGRARGAKTVRTLGGEKEET